MVNIIKRYIKYYQTSRVYFLGHGVVIRLASHIEDYPSIHPCLFRTEVHS